MDKDSMIVCIEGMDEVVSFTIAIPLAATFLQLKEEIEAKTGVMVERQIIFDKVKHETLPDNFTVNNWGFQSPAEVLLMVLPLPLGTEINITVSIPTIGDNFNLIVEDKQTVLELKRKICSIRNNIDPDEILLYHLVTEMEDNKQLYKYFVNQGSKIILLFH